MAPSARNGNRARNRRDRRDRYVEAQCASTLILAALMMGHHFSISAL
jgi:hypothetical protein